MRVLRATYILATPTGSILMVDLCMEEDKEGYTISITVEPMSIKGLSLFYYLNTFGDQEFVSIDFGVTKTSKSRKVIELVLDTIRDILQQSIVLAEDVKESELEM